MCDRDRGYGGCLPETPQPTVGAWRSPIHASLRQSGSFANALNTNRKNVWFGARSAEAYIRAGLGGVGRGELTRRERRAGGKATAGDGPPKALHSIYKGRCRVTAIYKRWHSLISKECECVELPNKNVSSGATTQQPQRRQSGETLKFVVSSDGYATFGPCPTLYFQPMLYFTLLPDSSPVMNRMS